MIIKRRMKKLLVLVLALFLTARGVSAAGVEYNLPYPGILPDSPFYVLKVWRDQLVTYFVRNPQDKAFYLLLLSDKRVAAGQVLINTGKVTLGVATLEQAQNYYQKAVDLANKNNRDLISKLVVAGVKHEEITTSLLVKVNGEDFTKLSKVLSDNQKTENRVTEVLTQP